MRKVEAKSLFPSNPTQYYDYMAFAADNGINYWVNYSNFVSGLIENRIISGLPQAIPSSKEVLEAVVRPKDINLKKNRVDAYVRRIRGEPAFSQSPPTCVDCFEVFRLDEP